MLLKERPVRLRLRWIPMRGEVDPDMHSSFVSVPEDSDEGGVLSWPASPDAVVPMTMSIPPPPLLFAATAAAATADAAALPMHKRHFAESCARQGESVGWDGMGMGWGGGGVGMGWLAG